MTSATESREAGGNNLLLPSCILLVYISIQPGAVHALHIHTDAMKHRRIESKDFTEGKKSSSKSIIAKSTVKINKQK